MTDEKSKEPGLSELFDSDDSFDVDSILPSESDHDEADDDGDGLEMDESQAEEIQSIFLATLPQYIEPVEEMVEQLLDGGDGFAETHQALSATLASLSEAASRIGVDSAYQLLDQMAARIAGLDPETGPGDQDRQGILADLRAIRALTGDDGAAPPPAGGRAGTIFSVLRDVAGIDEAALSRLTAAGLVSVDQLHMATPDEIAAVSGLDDEVVARILGALGRDDDADQAVAANVVELPLEAQSLHAQLESRLREQVEAEAALDSVRAEVSKLRSSIAELEDELSAATRRRRAVEAELGQLGTDVARRVAELSAVRAELGRAVERRDASQEALRAEEARLVELEEEQQQALADEARLGERVANLMEKVERMLATTQRW